MADICDFCGKEIERGTGKILIRNDFKTLKFCSSKCEKNMLKLRRNPRKTRWTNFAQTEKQKRLGIIKKKGEK